MAIKKSFSDAELRGQIASARAHERAEYRMGMRGVNADYDAACSQKN